MKKIINTHSAVLAVAMLILSLSASMFAQEETQIYQGCAESPYIYEGGNTYIWKMIGGQRKLVKIDRVQTGDSRMVFSFQPSGADRKGGKAAFVQGETIYFLTNKFGGDVNLQRKSQLAEEDFAPFNWSETILGSVGQTGDWYVIYQKAEDFIIPPDAERYIVPLKNLSADSASLQPQNIYSFKGATIFASPSNPPTPASVTSVVKKLNGMEFDTTGMPYGKYWFTLQSNAVFSGQTPSTCPKTTPPVLIEIVPPDDKPINYAPTVSIRISGEDCDQKAVTVYAGDRNNEAGDRLKPQTITLSWEILNKSNGAVVKSDTVTFTDAAYSLNIPTDYLSLGNYTVKAYVKDGYTDANAEGGFANEDLNIKCKGAGIAYFQFDEPYDGRVSYKPENYTNPESWVAVNRFTKVKNQCSVAQGLYPESEFADFYEKFKIDTPASVDTNKDKLDRILSVLMANPSYKILIYGYADFRNVTNYNVPLVNRRMEVVRNYLRTESAKLGQPIDDGRYTLIQNQFDSLARCSGSYYKDSCFVERRQDRRVELIYYADSYKIEDLNLPKYANSDCDPNAMLINNGEIEWETVE